MNNEFMQLLPLQAFYLLPVRSMALCLLKVATSRENAVIACKAAWHPLPRLRKARATRQPSFAFTSKMPPDDCNDGRPPEYRVCPQHFFGDIETPNHSHSEMNIFL